MRPLLVFIRKDLRLLWRDRAGLLFLLVAPLIVISVAGFSLANLYGADPTGQTAYDLPFVDEDGSKLAQQIRAQLSGEPAVRLRQVHDRAAAQRLVRDKKAGTALVIPRGTEAALAAGQEAKLILYSDPVKYLERINLRVRMLELRDSISTQRAADLTAGAAAARQRSEQELATLKTTVDEMRSQLDSTWRDAQHARQQLMEQVRRNAVHQRDEAMARIKGELRHQTADLQAEVNRQLDRLTSEFRAYVDSLSAARNDFENWLGELRRLAGSHAGDIPPPPTFPALPRDLQEIIDGRRPPLTVQLPEIRIDLAEPRLPQLPALPPLPTLEIPHIDLPEPPASPPSLGIEEVNLTGGPSHINTFDQNVPGFAVTFLMLGMLLGISLGLLDEREWGTLERMRALPVGPSDFMLAKLFARFLVGVVQMIILLIVGWLAFDVSLGPQPPALLLPTCGIAFAGTAFGLVVAAIAKSRESVFSVGSVVMVTMAAVGGCWWPIDLEPRWMRSVALAFPTTWAMDAFNDLMIRRRTVEAAFTPTAVMCAYGVLYLFAGLAIFRRRLRS
jgi:ABC-type multidrug transport system permease subunit/F0F1-type ATP synthase membrane subunit b/b'